VALLILFLFIFFLCWGSFLNVVAYRLIHEKEFIFSRSCCPTCQVTLKWYDLIPIFSFLFSGGICRYCKNRISLLYPLIELFTAFSCTLLFYIVSPYYFLPYVSFFSLLIISMRSDLENMVVSSYVTLYPLPIPLLLALGAYLPITFTDSLLGALSGYGCLWSIGTLFWWWTGKQGIGEGDFEILALIGAWTGMLGCWAALTVGSLLGVCAGFILQITEKKPVDYKIPFVPFLALGSILFVLFSSYILPYLF
jgi:leader peptidase (prepilin peptidase) / N-methyltransferase